MLRFSSRLVAFWWLSSMILAQGAVKSSLWLPSGQYFGSVENENGLSKRKDSIWTITSNDSTCQNFLVIRTTMFGETHC